MIRLGAVARVLWCETATLAIVLSGDIPAWLSVLVLTLIPIFGLAPPDARWVASARRVSSLVTAGYLFFFPFDWLHLSGRLIFATVHLMFYLKLHTLLHQRSERERARLHLICIFEMLAAASMTVDAAFVGPLTVFVVLGTLVLLLEQVRPLSLGGADMRTAAASALSVSLPILALAAAVFVALPRASDGGFRLGGRTGITTTGFSERVELGDFEEIRQSRDVVMRLVSDDGISPPRWRGPAYDRYFEGSWLQTLSGVSSLRRLRGGGGFLLNRPSDEPTSRTEIFLEPLDTDVVFLPPASSRIASNDTQVFIDPYWTLRTGRSSRSGRRYVVYWHSSRPSDTSPAGPAGAVARMSAERRALYTQLPELSERFHELAERIEGRFELEPLALARAVEAYLESSYGYTLSAPPRGRGDPIEDFLFDSRAGHCEYFATAMVLLMRAHDVPARLVTGFSRGERNPVSDFEVVRRSDAHAWVEVFDESSWMAFDPTPAASATAEELSTNLLSAGIESLGMFWDMYVIAFDLERQRGVLGGVGRLVSETTAGIARGVLWAIDHWKLVSGVTLGALAALVLYRSPLGLRLRFRMPSFGWARRRGRMGRAGFYEKLLARLERLGIERSAGQTPAELALAWEEHLPGFIELTDIYYRVRFGGERLDSGEARRAERLASAICLAALGDRRRPI